MISICIPIYNFNVTELVNELINQSSFLDVPSEIILIDDCSKSAFKKMNNKICKSQKYIELKKNIGRASIRNLFLNYAKYDSLLFLDCDCAPPFNFFLTNYIIAINKYPNQIIYGGREYQKIAPKRNKLLRWKYGFYKESKPCKVRMVRPNKSFMTNNFIISKKVFAEVKFDETLISYGHEDTLFGFELKKRGIKIQHIDNSILNGDLDNNVEYINNTEKAINNLIYILKKVNFDKIFIEDVTLLKVYFKFYRLRKLMIIIFLIFKPLLKYFFIRGYVNLYLFDFYKLGTLAYYHNKY